MKRYLLVAALGSLLVSAGAQADQNLAMQSGCLGCHKMDAKLIGPSFKDIAAKYAGVEGAADSLTAKVKAGSVPGEPLNWGSMPMPASPAAEANIKQVIEWVLTQQ